MTIEIISTPIEATVTLTPPAAPVGSVTVTDPSAPAEIIAVTNPAVPSVITVEQAARAAELITVEAPPAAAISVADQRVQARLIVRAQGVATEWACLPVTPGWTEVHPLQYKVILGGAVLQLRGSFLSAGFPATLTPAGGLPTDARPSTAYGARVPVATESAAPQFISINNDGSITVLDNTVAFECNCNVPLW